MRSLSDWRRRAGLSTSTMTPWCWCTPVPLRSPKQIEGFFAGLELIDPGVVSVSQWRSEATPFQAAGQGRFVLRRGPQAMTRRQPIAR